MQRKYMDYISHFNLTVLDKLPLKQSRLIPYLGTVSLGLIAIVMPK
jgi:hypothetical protein